MTHRARSVVGSVGVTALFFVMNGGVVAQEKGPDLFGPTVGILNVAAEEFVCSVPDDVEGCGYARGYDGWWYSRNSSGNWVLAPVNLPAGAMIFGIRVFFDDSDTDGFFRIMFERDHYHDGIPGSMNILDFATGTPGVTGPSEVWLSLDPPITVRYYFTVDSQFWAQKYILAARLAGTMDTSFFGVMVYWKRQVSPAPETATFADVATGHPYFQFVEALAASGITAGCGGGNYCPDDPITRGQMAVYLAAALGLHWNELTPGTS